MKREEGFVLRYCDGRGGVEYGNKFYYNLVLFGCLCFMAGDTGDDTVVDTGDDTVVDIVCNKHRLRRSGSCHYCAALLVTEP